MHTDMQDNGVSSAAGEVANVGRLQPGAIPDFNPFPHLCLGEREGVRGGGASAVVHRHRKSGVQLTLSGSLAIPGIGARNSFRRRGDLSTLLRIKIRAPENVSCTRKYVTYQNFVQIFRCLG